MPEPSINNMTMAQNAAFLNRVQYVGSLLARKALAGDAAVLGPDSTAAALKRNYCKRWLADPGAYAPHAAVLLVSDPSVSLTWTGTESSATDAAIEAALIANLATLSA